MVQIAGIRFVGLVSSLVLASMSIGSVWAGSTEAADRLTVRDVVNHKQFAHDLVHRYRGLISREEIHDIFARDLDTDLEDFLSRRDEFEELYARHPDSVAHFFECIGDFVKRAAKGYWRHTVLRAHALVGKNLKEWEREFDFLPRGFEEEETYSLRRRDGHTNVKGRRQAPAPSNAQTPAAAPAPQTWFSRALLQYRDMMLEAEERYLHDLDDLD